MASKNHRTSDDTTMLAVRPRSPLSSSKGKRRRAVTATESSVPHRLRDETADQTSGWMEGDDIYDPDQPVEERRRVQKEFRDLLRGVTDNSEEYLQAGSQGLHNAIIKANELSKQVRQTTEATIDSRLLVSTTDLSYRKTLRLTQGSLSQGLDVDEFVSKCIIYMRQGDEYLESSGTELFSTQRNANRSLVDDDNELSDEGDMMNWSHMGAFACLPYSRRPALPGLLLGPLSMERKLRKAITRNAPFRPSSLLETRPEVLNVDDLAKRENDLTAMCGKILQQLLVLQAHIQEAVAIAIEDVTDHEMKMRIMHQHGLRSTGGLDLLTFCVNPRSFGQTIENLFYISFLIRDGRVEVDFDENDLPSIAPVMREVTTEGSSRTNAAKHQAILSIDMETWQDIIDTFDLQEPMIEHREETSGAKPGARSWYS